MLRRLLLAGLAAAAAGCQTVETTQAGAVGVEREQRMLVSSEQINASAEKAYAQMMAEAKAKGVLNRDPAQLARVAGDEVHLAAQARHPEAMDDVGARHGQDHRPAERGRRSVRA